MNTKIHYIEPSILTNIHAITINVIGVGGTGSHLLSQLAIINHALTQQGHPPLHVNAYDDDSVELHNVGRQKYYTIDNETSKVNTIISRINRAYSLKWKAFNGKYEQYSNHKANFTITCTDTIASRLAVAKSFKTGYFPNTEKSFYWLDIGNSLNTSQFVLGTTQNIKQPIDSRNQTIDHLPTIFELFPDLTNQKDDLNETPSCSMAEALSKQDLFINSITAIHVAKFLYEFILNRATATQGLFINLPEYKFNPINIK